MCFNYAEKLENNRMEEIGLVTPTPGHQQPRQL